jgi:LmbE family N-acetylglucosaminyl deacetylase
MEMERKVLLAVLAHPDDESFGMGGTLALYARRGVDVYLVCATRGEVGDVDSKYLDGYASVAERRESELRCAAQKLGLKDVFFLNYRDSGMPGSPDNLHPQALVAQPLEKVAQEIVHYMRLLRPQVVITFDPIGGYRHPDHIFVHNATVSAFHAAGDPAFAPNEHPAHNPQKLYFHTIPHTLLSLAVKVMPVFGKDPRRFGRNNDIDLVSIAEVRFPVHARIDYRPVIAVREDASACHASQDGGRLMGGPLNGIRRLLMSSNETFMRAYPEPQPHMPVEKDLFEGLA